MSANTKIEWADHTFNPWIGCTKVGPGCDNCYAKAEWDDRRHRAVWGAGQARSRTKTWGDPVKWNKQHEAFFAEHGRRQRVFCASLADVFDNEVPETWRIDLFDVIEQTPNLDWLLLTKRIGNVARMLPWSVCSEPWPNVWIGATIVNQEEADRDIPKLLAVPAAKRFLSMEPLLGLVDLDTLRNFDLGEGQPYLHPLLGLVGDGHGDVCTVSGIDWVIAGGESGPNARPMHPDWVRSLRDQCEAAGVPFLFKQWGEWRPPYASGDALQLAMEHHDPKKEVIRCGNAMCTRVGKKAAGRLLDGREHNGVPS